MPEVVEAIPDALAAEAEAARTWFSKERGSEFKLTGIVDPDDVGERVSATAKREFQLILCGSQDGQEVCLRERFALRLSKDGFDVAHLKETDPGSPAPLLDPPAGVRKGWLDAVAAKHAFIVLVFYRGFWCPPCRRELLGYKQEGVVKAIRDAGGEIYAVTSEPHSLALNAQKEWKQASITSAIRTMKSWPSATSAAGSRSSFGAISPTSARRSADRSPIPKGSSSPERSRLPVKDVCCTGGEVFRAARTSAAPSAE